MSEKRVYAKRQIDSYQRKLPHIIGQLLELQVQEAQQHFELKDVMNLTTNDPNSN